MCITWKTGDTVKGDNFAYLFVEVKLWIKSAQFNEAEFILVNEPIILSYELYILQTPFHKKSQLKNP